jgi:hypothetical protein
MHKIGGHGAAMRTLLLLLFATTLTACYNDIPQGDPRHEEIRANKAWLDQLKLDDRATAKLLAEQCYEEGAGSPWSSEGVLDLTRCMCRKYDEGVRA